MANITACLSTGKDNWETPDALFNLYHTRYDFVLDAAADSSNHKVNRWFGPGGIVEDALSADWEPWLHLGNIWLNPPYSKGLQSLFVMKALSEIIACEDPDCGSVVCLLPSRTDTKLFHEVILPNAEIHFLKGRVKFVGAAAGAPFPSMIAIF